MEAVHMRRRIPPGPPWARCLDEADRAGREEHSSAVSMIDMGGPLARRDEGREEGAAYRIKPMPRRGSSSSIPHERRAQSALWLRAKRNGASPLAANQPMAGRPGRHPYRWRLVKRTPSCHLQPQRRKRVVVATSAPGHEIAVVSTRRMERHARPRRIRGSVRFHGRARRCHRGWQSA